MRKWPWVLCLLLYIFFLVETPSGHAAFPAVKVKEINGFEIWSYPGVSAQKINITVRTIQETVKYFESQGATLPDQARKILLVSTKAEMAGEVYNHNSGMKRNMAYATQIASNSEGEAFSSSLIIMAGSNFSDVRVAQIAAHELSHAHQNYLGLRTSKKAPQWFREGTAEYWSTQATRFIEQDGLNKMRAQSMTNLRNEKLIPSLAKLSTNTDFESIRLFLNNSNSPYSLSFLAVDELVALAGEKSLASALKNLEDACLTAECNPSPIFKDVFSTTFGLSLDEFMKKFSDKLQQQGCKMDFMANLENYPGKETLESRTALGFAYKGRRESWGPTFAVKEFDKLAPPPGMNWVGNVHDWIEQAALSYWQTSTDPLQPQVGAILIRSDRQREVIWVYIIREVNSESLVAEIMTPAGKRVMETFKLADLPKQHFAGYIYPVRMK